MHKIVPSYTSSTGDTLILRDEAPTYGLTAAESSDVLAPWEALCCQSPAALAVYEPSASGGYKLLHGRPGVPLSAFENFCAVQTPLGWQVLQPPASAWLMNESRQSLPQGSDAPPMLQEAAGSLARDTPFFRTDATWDSLFASFLGGGGVNFDAFIAHDRLPSDRTERNHLLKMSRFIQRQDLIYQFAYGDFGATDIPTDNRGPPDEVIVAAVMRRMLPAAHPRLSIDDLVTLSAEAQFGLLRSMTSAHVAIYMQGQGLSTFIKTHERFGEPSGKARNFAAAYTAEGWMSVPGEGFFSAGPFAKDLFVRNDMKDDGRRYQTLFDAFLLGGGVWVELPEAVPFAAQNEYGSRQLDVYIWRWRSCVRLQSQQQASSWGRAYRARVAPRFQAVADAATQWLPPPTDVALQGFVNKNNDDLSVWSSVGVDTAGRLFLRSTATQARDEDFAFEDEATGRVDVQRTQRNASPRRLTWPALAESPPGSPEFLARSFTVAVVEG